MKYSFILFICFFFSFFSHGQNDSIESSREDALKVFIDCNFCDLDFLRGEINYINYVRDRMVAQVHVLTTSQRTGSGGTEYTFNFIGQKEFLGQNDTISVVVNADATSDVRRVARAKYLEFGLMQYVIKTPLVDLISINYSGDSSDAEAEEVVDKWDFWVFRLSSNGWFNGQELTRSMNINGSVSANRITEKWKFENWGNFGYNENRFKIDSATTIVNSNENYYFESLAVRSLNNHWSVGALGTVNSSTFSNIKLRYEFLPTLEYNVFDYDDFTRKQIRFQYRLGFSDFQYVDTTIYNQIQESLFSHRLSVAAEFRQKWGSFNFSATASQYLHDTSLRRLTFWSSINWRIARGLTVNANGSLEFIQDQISLPKGGASDIEILTQQSLLATQYSYWGSLGISYTFGSIFNNIVNPRFGN